ncbi:amino acid ABC transporter substrate-binding protein [Herbaspirillum sp. YR522]|uniref:amino acid ABC transporter substrate-binding protein n=1 Tax=Herbaspirillum sp. YR522 TaxID=1144342 RepID=UPI00026F8877|nr:amino acid ABC transporter substrate-binding protein [Herbaspirillum sp. YR522]EJN02893.1 periplasmic component of amino acid ABC-type transporter/signal transduction system [Herbaspirillum sp. YR522]
MVGVRACVRRVLVARRACWFVAVLALACQASLSAHAEETVDKIRRTHTLVVAYAPNQFPFVSVEDGQPVGYAIDICNRIADGLRRELRLPQLQVRYLEVDTRSRFDAIADGQADIECGTTTNNAARRNRFAFTIPHFFTTTRMMVRRDSGIRSWRDLRERRVVMVRGTSVVPYAKARDASGLLNIQWVQIDREADAMSMLQQAQVDAYADDDVMLYSYRSMASDPGALVIVGEALSVDPYAMMMRQDPAFKALVDREMVRMISTREIHALYRQWFLAPAGGGRVAMNLPMGYLLRDSFNFPTDKVAQ